MDSKSGSLLSMDQNVVIDSASALRLVAILVAASIVVGLILKLTGR